MAAAATAAAAAVLAFQLGPHSFAQSWARDFLQHYTGGKRTPVTAQTERHVRRVMADMGFTSEEMSRTSAFVCYPQEAFSLGSLSAGASFLMGLPSQAQTAAVDLSKVRLGPGTGIPANKIGGEEARMYRDSMDLSDEAKRFIIARELSRGRLAKRQLLPLAATSSTAVAVAFSANLLLRARLSDSLFRRHRWSRYPVYLLVAAACACLCVLAQDWLRQRHAAACDAAACALGEEYARGGAEYYEKALQRHRALRALLPDGEGARAYTLRGDLVPGLLRGARHRPITTRKADCEKMLPAVKSGGGVDES